MKNPSGGGFGPNSGRNIPWLATDDDAAEAEITLSFDDNRLASRLFGQYDQNLAFIEKRLGIRATARAMKAAFAWAPGGFKNYFAVKALPNPSVMAILAEEGMGFDCSSLAELLRTGRSICWWNQTIAVWFQTTWKSIGRRH